MFDWKFYLFLYPELIDLGIDTKKKAYNHWIKYGKYENRISEHPDKLVFYWKDYLKNNKYLVKKQGIIDKRGAILHWYNKGKKEGRLLSKKVILKKPARKVNITKITYSTCANNYNNPNNQVTKKVFINKYFTKNRKIKKDKLCKFNSGVKDYSNRKSFTNVKTHSSKSKISSFIDVKQSSKSKISPIIYTNYSQNNIPKIRFSNITSLDRRVIKNLYLNPFVKQSTTSNLKNKQDLYNKHINTGNCIMGTKQVALKSVINNVKKEQKSIKTTSSTKFNLLNSLNLLIPRIPDKVTDDNLVKNKSYIIPPSVKQPDIIFNKPKPIEKKINKIDSLIVKNDITKDFNINLVSKLSLDSKKFKWIERYDSPNIIIYYKNLEDKLLIASLLYYKNYSVKIFVDNISDKLSKICSIINYNVAKFTNIKNILTNNPNYNFIGVFTEPIIIDSSILSKNIQNRIYVYNTIGKFILLPYNCIVHKDFVLDKDLVKNIHLIPKNILNTTRITFDKLQILDINFALKNKFNDNDTAKLENFTDEKYFYKYFDHIYILNLYRRPSRFKKTVNRLNKQGIYSFEQFFAVDGESMLLKFLYNLYCRKPYIHYEKKINRKLISSSGSLAILLSMYNMLKDAVKNKYKKIFVIQDDILIDKNFRKNCIESLSKFKDWKLLYLGGNDRNIGTRITDKIIEQKYYEALGKVDGAFAVGISENIYSELLTEISTFILPFDSGPLQSIQNKYPKKCLVVYPNIMIADVSESDCRPGRNQLTFSKKVLWNLNDFDLDKTYHKSILTIILYDSNNSFTNLKLEKFIENIKNIDCDILDYDILVLTSNIDKSYIQDNIRVYNIINRSNSDISNIYLGIILSYSCYVSIHELSDIDFTNIRTFLINLDKFTIYCKSDENIYNVVYNKKIILTNVFKDTSNISLKQLIEKTKDVYLNDI